MPGVRQTGHTPECLNLHYVDLDRWSRRDSFLHRRDARVKLPALLVFLIALATTKPLQADSAAAFAGLALVGIISSRLPLLPVLMRASVVLPFTVTFALISFFSGDAARGLSLLFRSLVSALAVVLLVATTPMPALLHAASSLGVPRILVLVLQFLYRYLFVVMDQAQRMRTAALCRGSALKRHHGRKRFRAAGSALAVLFARSYEKAEGIERAMLARGFDGRMHLLSPPRLGAADVTFLILISTLAIAFRFWFSRSA